MKQRLVFFPEWVIVDYLAKYAGENLQTTTNIEMFGALALIRLCERELGAKCVIGFDIQERYQADLPDQAEISVAEFESFIKEKIKTDSPIDFSIGTPETKERMDFQMKRFGKSDQQKTTEDLISYINSLAQKYGKTGCSLVILCESAVINALEVTQRINTENYPFDKIILVDMEDGGYINYSFIWASTGEIGESRLNFNTMTFEY